MEALATILFVLSGVGFILGLRMLGRPETARRGNLVSAAGMGAAVLGTLVTILEERRGLTPEALDGVAGASPDALLYVAGGLLVGVIVGIPAARLVKMTSMPEMVAIFNGFGGAASLLVGWGTFQRAAEAYRSARAGTAGDLSETSLSLTELLGAFGGGSGAFVSATIFLAVLIGGVTFTGSLVAFGKLAGVISTRPILYKGQNLINGLLLLVVVGAGVLLVMNPEEAWVLPVCIGLSFVLGVAAVIPIGGGDMPVVISLLNSYSGLAACAAGFATNNLLLIIVGALVGASGIILTRIMCLAMNRSLTNVLFSGFGAVTTQGAGEQGERREARSMGAGEAYYVLEAASNVVIVPGYGMAVAQAQHAVKELADLLEANGCEVRFAVHPVAGRMPGHMNVLLAEANVPYEQLAEIDDVNPSMETVDVALVIGANDVVNPDAKEEPSSPLYGMPIVEVDRARNVFVLKRSLRSGFAGVENPLFFRENTTMIFGDAKATLEALVGEFKSAD
ncbi:MAG: NAD(P)(+) transhydrogenase (Re/Si-specific) subunit beta [Phycisphaerales bacterium JB059]